MNLPPEIAKFTENLEKEQRAKQERAVVYRAMTELWAWKDLMTVFNEEERQNIDKLLNRQSVNDTHDYIKGLRFMKKEVDFIMDGI